jgi:hypothetical protein
MNNNIEYREELRSDCCNSDIIFTKGAYMGESYQTCWLCKRACSSYNVKVKIAWITEN